MNTRKFVVPTHTGFRLQRASGCNEQNLSDVMKFLTLTSVLKSPVITSTLFIQLNFVHVIACYKREPVYRYPEIIDLRTKHRPVGLGELIKDSIFNPVSRILV